MPKFIFDSLPQISLRLSALLLASLLLVAQAFGQTSNQSASPAPPTQASSPKTPPVVLPDKLTETWRALGASKTLGATESAVLPDGEILTEYDLQTLTNRTYTNGQSRVTVEVFTLGYPSSAYGLLTFNRETLANNRQEFQSGRYLISVASEKPATTIDASLLATLKQMFPSSAEDVPSLPSQLPTQNKIANSERYVVGAAALARLQGFSELKEIVSFTGGAEAVTANYNNGSGQMRVLIVEYHTPQLATDGFTNLQKYFDGLSQEEKARRILKRVGNFAIFAVGVQDQSAADVIIRQIKYAPKVYWEGSQLRDIPLSFRPPDEVAVNEAEQTARMLIRTFYWIGVMLLSALSLGILTGGTFFYWRRHRRRKLGLDDLFSDAGGTVRLNLDEYLLSEEKPAVKQIGKGDQ